MNRATLSFLWPIGTGAYLGAHVALALGEPWWWVGAAVGALISYLAYDFPTVLRTVRTMIKWRPSPRQLHRFRYIWAPGVVAYLALFSTLMVGLMLIFYLLPPYQTSFGASNAKGLLQTAVLLSFLTMPFAWLVSLNEVNHYGEDIKHHQQVVWRCICYGNALVFYAWVLPRFGCRVIKGVVYDVPREIWSSLHQFWDRLRTFVYLINSEKRVLCPLYGSLGVTVGYCTAWPLVGLVIGTIAGYFQHEVLCKRLPHQAAV